MTNPQKALDPVRQDIWGCALVSLYQLDVFLLISLETGRIILHQIKKNGSFHPCHHQPPRSDIQSPRGWKGLECAMILQLALARGPLPGEIYLDDSLEWGMLEKVSSRWGVDFRRARDEMKPVITWCQSQWKKMSPLASKNWGLREKSMPRETPEFLLYYAISLFHRDPHNPHAVDLDHWSDSLQLFQQVNSRIGPAEQIKCQLLQWQKLHFPTVALQPQLLQEFCQECRWHRICESLHQASPAFWLATPPFQFKDLGGGKVFIYPPPDHGA